MEKRSNLEEWFTYNKKMEHLKAYSEPTVSKESASALDEHYARVRELDEFQAKEREKNQANR